MAQNVQFLIDAYKQTQAQLADANSRIQSVGLAAIQKEAAVAEAALKSAMTANWAYKWSEDGTVLIKRTGLLGTSLETMAAPAASAVSPQSGAPAATVGTASTLLGSLGSLLKTVAIVAGTVALTGGGASMKGCDWGQGIHINWPVIHFPTPNHGGIKTVAYTAGQQYGHALPGKLGPIFLTTADAIRRGDDFSKVHAEHTARLQAIGVTPVNDPALAPFVTVLDSIIPPNSAAPSAASRAKYADALRDFGLGVQGLPPEAPGPVGPEPIPSPSPAPAPVPVPAAAVVPLPVPDKPQPAPAVASSQPAAPVYSGYGEGPTADRERGSADDGWAPSEDRKLQLASHYEARARRLYSQNDQAGAEVEFTNAILCSPNWALPYVHRANIRYAQGRYAAAANDYETASKLDPDYPELLKSLEAARAAMKGEKQ